MSTLLLVSSSQFEGVWGTGSVYHSDLFLLARAPQYLSQFWTDVWNTIHVKIRLITSATVATLWVRQSVEEQ